MKNLRVKINKDSNLYKSIISNLQHNLIKLDYLPHTENWVRENLKNKIDPDELINNPYSKNYDIEPYDCLIDLKLKVINDITLLIDPYYGEKKFLLHLQKSSNINMELELYFIRSYDEHIDNGMNNFSDYCKAYVDCDDFLNNLFNSSTLFNLHHVNEVEKNIDKFKINVLFDISSGSKKMFNSIIKMLDTGSKIIQTEILGYELVYFNTDITCTKIYFKESTNLFYYDFINKKKINNYPEIITCDNNLQIENKINLKLKEIFNQKAKVALENIFKREFTDFEYIDNKFLCNESFPIFWYDANTNKAVVKNGRKDDNDYKEYDITPEFITNRFHKLLTEFKKEKSTNFTHWLDLVDDFYRNINSYTIEQKVSINQDIKDIEDKLTDEEKNSEEYLQYTDFLDEIDEKLENYNQDNIYLLKESVKDYINHQDESDLDKIFDFIETDLNDDIYNEDIEKILDSLATDRIIYEDVDVGETLKARNVFINDRAKKEYESIDDQRNKDKIKDIVHKMKTLSNRELNQILYGKLGLNHPGNKINNKIRITFSGCQIRICFWYGKDMPGREDNKDDIYIYKFITNNHDQEIDNLDRYVPEQAYKECQYHEFSFGTDEQIDQIFPELSKEQYFKTSKNNEAILTFGCAGSGKTSVSIDQYERIGRDVLHTNEPNSLDLVYITYSKKLNSDAIRQLTNIKDIKTNCFYLNEFFLNAKIEEDKYDSVDINNTQYHISSENTFVKWFRQDRHNLEIEKEYGYSHDQDKKISKIINKPDLERFIYTYYRGLFKGSVKALKSKNNHLNEEEFLEELTGERYLSKEEKKELFYICEQYYIYASNNNYLDDNDLAIIAYNDIKQRQRGKYKNIIIDEVQDLTELQLYTILSAIALDGSIYLYGDPHQTINPTIFSKSMVEKVCKEVLNIEVKFNFLKYAYRTNSALVSYLKRLEDLRRKYIGKFDDYDIDISNSNINNHNLNNQWASFLSIEEYKEEAIYKACHSDDTMIIVPNSEVKEELLNKYKDVAIEARVQTVYEMKGLEKDKVLLYRMISNSKDYFEDMVNDMGKQSTIHRMIFNKYYVACSRARKTFVVVEDRMDENVFMELVKDLYMINKKEDIGLYLAEQGSFTGWFNDGIALIENGMFEKSLHSFSTALSFAKTEEEKKKCYQYLESKSNQAKIIELAQNHMKEKHYKSARTLYSLVEDEDMIRYITFLLHESLDAKDYQLLLSSNLITEENVVNLQFQNEFINTIKLLKEKMQNGK